MSTEKCSNDEGEAVVNRADESSVDPNSVEGIFLQALKQNDPQKLDAFLDERCGSNEERRNRVRALLRAYDDAGSFLETPAVRRPPSDEFPLTFLVPADREGSLGMLGEYVVLDVIGRGGMGLVFRALDPKLDRVVAIKVLIPELAANANSRRRFLREARAAAAVSHPHVVTIHAVEESPSGTDGDEPVPPYLVMECVVGQSLQEKINRTGALPLDEILRISRQVAEGLAAAHQQGLVHRDIKPGNILLENGVERVKITDFGLARAIDDVTVTRTGELSGTPQYMSPEQASADHVGHRSDLFSLGCVMYAMCTGHSPFRADSLAHVIKRVTQDRPRGIADQNAEIPAWLIEIVDSLLQKDPRDRCQDARHLVSILDQHLAQIQQPVESASHSQINQRLQPETAPTRAVVSGKRQPGRPAATWRQRTSGSLLWSGTVLVIAGLAGLITLINNPLIFETIPSIDRNSHLLVIAVLGAGMLLLIAGALLRGDRHASSTSLLAFYILLGPLGILLWLIDRDQRERSMAQSSAHENRATFTDESMHGKVGRCLLQSGLFLIVQPLLLIAAGPLIQDGDIMELGGSLAMVGVPLGVISIALGYALRYVLDRQQEHHRRMNPAIPCALAILIAGLSAAYQWADERAVRIRGQRRAQPAVVAPGAGRIAVTPRAVRSARLPQGSCTQRSVQSHKSRCNTARHVAAESVMRSHLGVGDLHRVVASDSITGRSEAHQTAS